MLLTYPLKHLHQYLRRVRKPREASEDLTNEPLILELSNRKIYAGLVDECYDNGGVVIALYNCKLLDESNVEWIDHGFVTLREGSLVAVDMPDFCIEDIREIYGLRKEFQSSFGLDDLMQMYIDPYYEPLIGVHCEWNNIEVLEHHENCDVRLHEALYWAVTHWASNKESHEERMRFLESCEYVTRRLLMAEAQIPRFR